MIEPERSLIRSGDNFGRGGVGACAECSLRIVRQRITGQQRRNFAADRNGQGIAAKSCRVDSLPLRLSRHGEYLRCPQNLPESLIFREIKCLAPAIVNMRNEDRTAVGDSEFIARERRKAPRVQIVLVVKEISRVECRIAHKLKQTSVHLIAA